MSSLHFIAYAHERSIACSNLFAEILLNHLQNCNVSSQGCRLQTDNGGEFIGSWNTKEDGAFTKTVESIQGLIHKRIPPAAHTRQADAETAREDFLSKAATYNLWFNVAKKNSHKGDKTPWEIIRERNPDIRPEIVALPPVFLDELLIKKPDLKSKRGYDVIPHPYFAPA